MTEHLVVYSLRQHPLRSTVRDHLYSFRRYGRARYTYLNIGVRKVPRWIRDARFDAVIYHTSFLAQRWDPDRFRLEVARAEPLRGIGRYAIAMPQDEFLGAEMVSHFVRDFEVDHVFSVSPRSEWSKIYPDIDRGAVRFSEVLTGYLDDDTVARIDRIAAGRPDRSVDVGYRASPGRYWLGRHGMLKEELARVFARAAADRDLRLDISNRYEDVLSGDDWFAFLASCRYTLGVEGGASVLDRTGEIKEATERYLRAHPDAGFEEVERHCFPGRDGELALAAISPRHLEACATRTCQILIEGSYSGVLRPGEHYIELRRDLGNLDEVLDAASSEELREEITQRAYEDIVASGRWSYRVLVEKTEAAVPPGTAGDGGRGRAVIAAATDRAWWVPIAVESRTLPVVLRLERWSWGRRLLDRLRRRRRRAFRAADGGD